MKDRNPFIYNFLTTYSQSERSTGGTRGYDANTYVDTKLDISLTPIIFKPTTKLVILTGNAGDGKTAFIQRIENKSNNEGASFTKKKDNGSLFQLNNIIYETLYDGSQDFEGTKNDAVLASFFNAFEGDKPPEGNFTKIIAINEGRLRDFIFFKSQYKWLGNQVHHYLENEDYKLHESLIFVNLNLRSVVGFDRNSSIFDDLLDKILDIDGAYGFWEPCKPENCSYADKCYIKYNVDNLRDPIKGPKIRDRLRLLLLVLHFRKIRHITMRDLRSALSFILFNKYTCEQLQKDIDEKCSTVDRFYYNAVFNSQEYDRIITILSEIDVAAATNPKLDNLIYFHEPENPKIQSLLISGENKYSTDISYLNDLFNSKPEGTEDKDIVRFNNAKLYHSSIRRKLFFEGEEALLQHADLPGWKELLPYYQFDRFINTIIKGTDSGGILRNDLTLAISKSEGIYNDNVGIENVCIRTTSGRHTEVKAFYIFSASEFEVVVKDIGEQSAFLEYLPNCLYCRHVDNKAILEIPLDLFEILFRIHDGYVPTVSEMRNFFINLEMFKRHVASKSSARIILTEDDTSLFEIKRDPSQRIIMAKLGG
jgi:hypothetical protein